MIFFLNLDSCLYQGCYYFFCFSGVELKPLLFFETIKNVGFISSLISDCSYFGRDAKRFISLPIGLLPLLLKTALFSYSARVT